MPPAILAQTGVPRKRHATGVCLQERPSAPYSWSSFKAEPSNEDLESRSADLLRPREMHSRILLLVFALGVDSHRPELPPPVQEEISVDAVMNYLDPIPRPLLGIMSKTMPIYDARNSTAIFSLEKNGFQMSDMDLDGVPCTSMDVLRDAAMRSKIADRATAVLKREIPAASHIIPFDVKVRQGGMLSPLVPVGLRAFPAGEAPPANGSVYGPAASTCKVIHGDYAKNSAMARVRAMGTSPGPTGETLLKPEQREALLQGECNFWFVNVWGNLAEQPLRRDPLALLDQRTLNSEDTFAWTQRGSSGAGVCDGFSKGAPEEIVEESRGVRFSPRHRWYYWSNMSRQEALIFKTYDSAEDSSPQVCFHSAFVHPSTPEAAPGRQSYEVRSLVVLASKAHVQSDSGPQPSTACTA
ncbi:asaB [Symbiodinium sp. CCMP2592]|nr:asaB [Symbiodinium sp. CCMP2592]